MYEVRDGKIVALTCEKCGCRLLVSDNTSTHYYGDDDKDARGCRCPLYNVITFHGPEPLDKAYSFSVAL